MKRNKNYYIRMIVRGKKIKDIAPMNKEKTKYIYSQSKDKMLGRCYFDGSLDIIIQVNDKSFKRSHNLLMNNIIKIMDVSYNEKNLIKELTEFLSLYTSKIISSGSISNAIKCMIDDDFYFDGEYLYLCIMDCIMDDEDNKKD